MEKGRKRSDLVEQAKSEIVVSLFVESDSLLEIIGPEGGRGGSV